MCNGVCLHVKKMFWIGLPNSRGIRSEYQISHLEFQTSILVSYQWPKKSNRDEHKRASLSFFLVYQAFAWGVVSAVFHNNKKGEATNADQQGC